MSNLFEANNAQFDTVMSVHVFVTEKEDGGYIASCVDYDLSESGVDFKDVITNLTMAILNTLVKELADDKELFSTIPKSSHEFKDWIATLPKDDVRLFTIQLGYIDLNEYLPQPQGDVKLWN